MSDQEQTLQASVARLRQIVNALDPSQLDTPAYPSEWSIADVLSHLGSGAEIMERRLGDSLSGSDTPDDFAPSVWDAWNAKEPAAQAADAPVADRALLERIGAVSDEERDPFTFAMGPMTLDWDGFLGLRLNEHALHLWDIEVALDPTASLAPEAVEHIVDNLELIARFTGRPSGEERSISVRTSDPRRDFLVTLGPDAVMLAPSAPVDPPDLELGAEAFIRLVYGRLDPDHTPPTKGPADLDELRRAFPGP
ncbi:MAG TPA: maleylpyruvate isomerase family mycothiol-dependent enzyme [Acidimicrobiales bacterium]|nr:maleylpyruvate isomerase family mycothiol-dependent enzyme [Acidimicrobiales bacterium]